MNGVLDDALVGLEKVVVELASGEKLFDRGYADDLVCLFQSTEHVQSALDKLSRSVSPIRHVYCTFEVQSAVRRLGERNIQLDIRQTATNHCRRSQLPLKLIKLTKTTVRFRNYCSCFAESWFLIRIVLHIDIIETR